MPPTHVDFLPPGDLDAFVEIAANAYPSMQAYTRAEQDKLMEHLRKGVADDPSTHLVGAWRDGRLVGGMRYFDFTMRLFETTIPVGGVGMVAVDLLHKKQHIAKDMLTAFLRHYKDRGAPMVSLYAFRHDFYMKMGFGYGTKMSQYRLRPSQLPARAGKQHVVFLGPDDAEQMLACYERVYARTHGYMARDVGFFRRMLAHEEHRIVGYRRDSALRGYLVWTFKPAKADNPFLNDTHIGELVYADGEALGGLMGFLQSQADQINLIVHNTQDEDFHHLPLDPRDDSRNNYFISHQANTQAVGIMYRLLDTRAVFDALAGHDFNAANCRLRLHIADSFFPENAGVLTLHVADGKATVRDDGDAEVEVTLDVAQLSSLLMGSVRFRSLHDFGLTTISDPTEVDVVDRIFAPRRKPMCLTRF